MWRFYWSDALQFLMSFWKCLKGKRVILFCLIFNNDQRWHHPLEAWNTKIPDLHLIRHTHTTETCLGIHAHNHPAVQSRFKKFNFIHFLALVILQFCLQWALLPCFTQKHFLEWYNNSRISSLISLIINIRSQCIAFVNNIWQSIILPFLIIWLPEQLLLIISPYSLITPSIIIVLLHNKFPQI